MSYMWLQFLWKGVGVGEDSRIWVANSTRTGTQKDCLFFTVWPWALHLASLNLRFLWNEIGLGPLQEMMMVGGRLESTEMKTGGGTATLRGSQGEWKVEDPSIPLPSPRSRVLRPSVWMHWGRGEKGHKNCLSPSSKTWNNYFYNCPKVTQRRGLGEGKGEVLMKLHRKGTFIIYIVHFSALWIYRILKDFHSDLLE